MLVLAYKRLKHFKVGIHEMLAKAMNMDRSSNPHILLLDEPRCVAPTARTSIAVM